jgi:hypothetical protein
MGETGVTHGCLKQKSAKNNRGHGLEFLCTGARTASPHYLRLAYGQPDYRGSLAMSGTDPQLAKASDIKPSTPPAAESRQAEDEAKHREGEIGESSSMAPAWSRLMRYAVAYKPDAEPLDQFARRKGGINACAARFTRRIGRGKRDPRRSARG